jgi:hypothetical protein
VKGSSLLGGCLLSLLTLLCAVAPARAQEAVIVSLASVNGSEVSGRASLTAEGAATRVALEVNRLGAGRSYVARVHSGTCAQPSASFADLSTLTPDGSGQAKAAGSIRFRATEDVSLTTLTDGQHVIVVSGPDGPLACGIVPAAEGAVRYGPARLPAAGGRMPHAPLALLAGVGLAALASGLWLRGVPRRTRV